LSQLRPIFGEVFVANGSAGAVVTGLVIGVILATQAIDFGAGDEGDDGVDDNPAAQSESQPGGANSDGSDSDGSDSDGSDGSEIPTQVEGGLAGPPPGGIITSTGRGGRTVALTFSTGPDPGSTPEVLDILDGHGVDATFCVGGTSARAQPELIRRIAAEGHALCDQGLGHDVDLSTQSDDRVQREIGLTLDAIAAIAPGATVSFFRAPGGDFSTRLNDIAAAYGQVPLGWSVDIADSAGPGARAIVDSVMDRVEPGAVILLHDGGPGRSSTVAVLDILIGELHEAGYAFVVPAP
jgi:peptidoglycan/xylan/chitin deacetylase (PgdA/CDA1 family)